jgi:UDP-glucose 4-epimerase
MMRILIPGGAGFIGSHLADALVAQNHQVVIIDNLSTGNFDHVQSHIFHKEDIADPVAIEHLFDKYQFDYVFHLAAQINLRHSIKEPAFDAHTNIVGSLNIIENCVRTGVRKLIFSSTGGAIYSHDAPLPWTEQSNADPQSPYGLAKLTVEKYLRLFSLPYVALRYSNVYGPRQNSKGEAGVISIFTEKALRNEDIVIFGSGEQTRDFIDVESVVKANLLAMSLEGTYNVSSNTQTSVNDIAKMILEKTQSSSRIIHREAVSGELMHTQLSFEKLAKEGWQPSVSLEMGIERTIEWFWTIYGEV